MTITQLEYVLAVDLHRNFGKAAEKCFVTQPTLSMQIQKLEEELGIVIFDRTKKPIQTTETGKILVQQSIVALREFNKVKELIKIDKGDVSGELSIGIIPTIAPYLVPLFIVNLMSNYKDLKVKITEMTTAQILKELDSHTIDCGILATPLHRKQIVEEPLYYEPLVVYLSPNHELWSKNTLTVEDLSQQDLLMLTEEHCLQSQIRNLCPSERFVSGSRLNYTTGSLETIKHMVDLSNGITLLPELAAHNLNEDQMLQLRYFRGEEPVREISLVSFKGYRKASAVEALKKTVIESVPVKMRSKVKKNVVPL